MPDSAVEMTADGGDGGAPSESLRPVAEGDGDGGAGSSESLRPLAEDPEPITPIERWLRAMSRGPATAVKRANERVAEYM